VHLFVKSDIYANPDVVGIGSLSADRMNKNPAIREELTQTFLVKKRHGVFAITKIASDLNAPDIRKDPPEGDSSTYRIDVALNPQKIKAGKLAGDAIPVTTPTILAGVFVVRATPLNPDCVTGTTKPANAVLSNRVPTLVAL
jgi:hypothetical protein